MKFDVISFGSAVLDAFVKAPDLKVVDAPEMETKKALVLPYGIKADVERLIISSGGGGTNTAVGFARLGLKAAVVARCGWDLAGKLVRQEIKKEGVIDSLLVQTEGEETDYSTILIGPDGGRTILVYRGGTRLERSVIDFKQLNSFWFFTSSLEGNLDLLADLVKHAQENHIKIAANPGRREIEAKEKLLEIAKDLTVLIVNQAEAAKLLGVSIKETDILAKLAQRLPQVTVVVTNGAEGVEVAVPGKGKLVSHGFKVKMVDATGAGDGFGAGLIGGLAEGWELEKALKLGVSNGASVVTKVGAKTGLIKEKEIDFWLEKPLQMSWQK